MTIDISSAIAAIWKVACSPATNAWGGAFVILIMLDCCSAVNVKIDPRSGTPVVCPSVLESDSNPDAIPNRSGGTDPKMALLFGD
jgi:hypothetical protein